MAMLSHTQRRSRKAMATLQRQHKASSDSDHPRTSTPTSARPHAAGSDTHKELLSLAREVAGKHRSIRACLSLAEKRLRTTLHRGKAEGHHNGTTDRMRGVLSRAKRSLLLLLASERRVLREFLMAHGVDQSELPTLLLELAVRRQLRAESGRSAGAGAEARPGSTAHRGDAVPGGDEAAAGVEDVNQSTAFVDDSQAVFASPQQRRGHGGRPISPSVGVQVDFGRLEASPQATPAPARWEVHVLRRTRRHLTQLMREYVLVVALLLRCALTSVGVTTAWCWAARAMPTRKRSHQPT